MLEGTWWKYGVAWDPPQRIPSLPWCVDLESPGPWSPSPHAGLVRTPVALRS